MKQAVQLGTLSAVNMGLTFLIQWYILTNLGPGLETDALFAGMTLPQLVLTVISGSLMHVLVPLLAGEDERQLRQDAWGFLVLVCVLFGFLATLLYAAAPWWVPITVPGFNSAGQELTVKLTRIQLIGMVFAAINGVQWAAYHAQQKFVWAEVTPILASIAALLALVWALPRFGVTAAAWITTMAMVLQTLLLVSGMGKPRWINLESIIIQQAWRRIKPLLLGTAYYKTDPLVDRFLLSTSGSGSLSIYYLAQQIYGAINQIINKTIAAPLVPILSNLHKTKNRSEFGRLYRRKLYQVFFVSAIGLIFLGLFGQAALGFLVGYGNVSSESVERLWWTMVWLGGMFIGGAMGQISSVAFYASGDTVTPTRIGIYTYTFYVPIKIGLFYLFDIRGVALATSFFLLINFFLQNWLLKKNVSEF